MSPHTPFPPAVLLLLLPLFVTQLRVVCSISVLNQWSEVGAGPREPMPLQMHTATVLDSYLVVFGGLDMRTLTVNPTTWVLDLSINVWQQCPESSDAPPPRLLHTMVAVDVAIINATWSLPAAVRSSSSSSSSSSSKPQQQPASNNSSSSSSSSSSTGKQPVMIGEQVGVLYGGTTLVPEPQPYSDVWVFHAPTCSWTLQRDIVFPGPARAGHAAVTSSSGTEMLVLGGCNGLASDEHGAVFCETDMLADIWLLDMSLRVWRSVVNDQSSMPGLFMHNAVVVPHLPGAMNRCFRVDVLVSLLALCRF